MLSVFFLADNERVINQFSLSASAFCERLFVNQQHLDDGRFVRQLFRRLSQRDGGEAASSGMSRLRNNAKDSSFCRSDRRPPSPGCG